MEQKGDETNNSILVIVLNMHAQKPSHNNTQMEIHFIAPAYSYTK